MQNINVTKWVSRLIFFIALAALIFLGLFKEELFDKYSDLMSVLSTLAFIWLTYETLRQTIQSETVPYINVKFLLASYIDENTFKTHGGLMMDSRIKQFIEDFKKADPSKKDLVFVKVENLGEMTAIDVRLNFEYVKHNFSSTNKQTQSIDVGVLRGHESQIKFIDSFEAPAKGDNFKIQKFQTFDNTIQRKSVSDGNRCNKISNITSETIDDNVTITLEK